MGAKIFRIVMLATLAAAPSLRASAAEETDKSLTKALPEWFNRQSPEYYTMPPFVLPVIERNEITRQVTFLITLETMGSANREKLMEKRPQLQDGFLRDLYGVIAVRPDIEVYSSDAIKTRLQRVGDRVVGDGIIDNILVNVTYDRRVPPEMRHR